MCTPTLSSLAADQVSEASATLQARGYRASFCLLHPLTYHRIRTERATTEEYVAAPWSASVAPNIFGVPVVVSASIAQNTALVMDREAAVILDRKMLQVRMSDQAGDAFTKNMVVFRAEGRWGLAILSPSGILNFSLSF